jgi:drug/metabolite transporter (DMT)-like permease
VHVALVGKGTKAIGAVLVVAVLSILFIARDLATEGHSRFLLVYAIGAAAGLAVSIVTAVRIKNPTPNVRVGNFVLTLGALVCGAAILSMQSVAVPLVGQKGADDLGTLIFNYGLGYFMVGVSFDAVRVSRAWKLRQNKK